MKTAFLFKDQMTQTSSSYLFTSWFLYFCLEIGTNTIADIGFIRELGSNSQEPEVCDMYYNQFHFLSMMEI